MSVDFYSTTNICFFTVLHLQIANNIKAARLVIYKSEEEIFYGKFCCFLKSFSIKIYFGTRIFDVLCRLHKWLFFRFFLVFFSKNF